MNLVHALHQTVGLYICKHVSFYNNCLFCSQNDPLWSAKALIGNPDVVKNVHKRFSFFHSVNTEL